jgi:hypothetical protein
MLLSTKTLTMQQVWNVTDLSYKMKKEKGEDNRVKKGVSE